MRCRLQAYRVRTRAQYGCEVTVVPGKTLASDVESIAENDQLDDLVIVRGEVEGKHQRFWQSSLVKIAVDICGDDEVP